ncbi:hypothetical protein BY996DRAFT_6998494 [Phakopsora pachyrhizi]|nr:hypothetical protein BY996DRAFT_6998494 [Phakopsora pachyrhizi]
MNSFSLICASFLYFLLVLLPIQVVCGWLYFAGVLWALNSVCKFGESFSSGLSPGEKKVLCMNGMEDTKFDFTLKNKLGQSKTISKEQCIVFMQKSTIAG